jgi:RNA polymerase sigma-70 factor, ECF subfamily
MEDDFQAIQRLKKGDISGLETLVSRYQLKAARSAFLILRDQSKAEDITQQTFLKIYRHIRVFDETKAFEPYLMKSILNASLDEDNRSKNVVELEEEMEAVEVLMQRASIVENEMERSELKREIHIALDRLTLRQRAAVVMRYYLEMSEQEMAEVLKTPPGTVKWLLHEARSRLRVLLGTGRSES